MDNFDAILEAYSFNEEKLKEYNITVNDGILINPKDLTIDNNSVIIQSIECIEGNEV